MDKEYYSLVYDIIEESGVYTSDLIWIIIEYIYDIWPSIVFVHGHGLTLCNDLPSFLKVFWKYFKPVQNRMESRCYMVSDSDYYHMSQERRSSIMEISVYMNNELVNDALEKLLHDCIGETKFTIEVDGDREYDSTLFTLLPGQLQEGIFYNIEKYGHHYSLSRYICDCIEWTSGNTGPSDYDKLKNRVAQYGQKEE